MIVPLVMFVISGAGVLLAVLVPGWADQPDRKVRLLPF